ncbi:AbrB family transcriptional regulator [Celeribacter indicus]|uniref:Ammonia monooxygenase superfamily protein n=1 Tax=Celeribacter indicus TaxID=1208324 RepID=A0A0B5E810_9RHOB|nr:AbrB family transcriptional regulator [Celeribacter indicus]AJE49151.1 ammonia monooxygenase superfamily protein [Celeribacter indicus]SDX17646.1 hypothetical protein SAMN05443573_11632 [Celeribacter indicus]
MKSDTIGPRLTGYGLAAALGLVGGFCFQWIGSPLPWFLGPMLFNAVFAIAGAPILGPDVLRPIALPVLGVMLGSAFLPEIFRNAGAWALSLGLIPFYVALSSGVNYAYFRRIARRDPVTSFFSSVPGGLNDMIILGEEYGGDTRQIALSHSMRILVSVLFLALTLVLMLGVSGRAIPRPVTHLSDISPAGGLVLLGCAVAGPFLGRVLRFPARYLLGPLFLSATAHLAGAVESGPPTLLSLSAQFVLGTGVGARFAGVSFASAALSMLHGMISSLIALAISAAIAVVALQAADIAFFEAFLGYAPGGMMEMSLLALAIGQSVAYVTIAHVTRYVIVMFTAPTVFSRLRTRW